MALAVRARLGLVLLGVGLVACGGQSQNDHGTDEAASAGAGGVEVAPNGGGDAGEPDTPTEAGTAGRLGEGGAPTSSGGTLAVGGEPNGGTTSVPLIASGSRLCVDERDCLGLDCVGALGLPTLTCAVRCPYGDECAPEQSCITSPLLEPTCLHRCDSPTQCDSLYDCFDAAKSGDFVCVPPAWTLGWQ